MKHIDLLLESRRLDLINKMTDKAYEYNGALNRRLVAEQDAQMRKLMLKNSTTPGIWMGTEK